MSEYSLLARSLAVCSEAESQTSCPTWRWKLVWSHCFSSLESRTNTKTCFSKHPSVRLLSYIHLWENKLTSVLSRLYCEKTRIHVFLTSQRWMTDPSPRRGKMLDASVSLRPPSIRPWWLSSSCVSWRHPATVVLLIHRERQGGKQFVQVSFCLNKHLKLSSVSHFTSHQGPSSH